MLMMIMMIKKNDVENTIPIILKEYIHKLILLTVS